MTATTPTQRREAQRAQTRSAILSATESLLIEHGVEAFSIRKLVAACGYTAPTIYQHFGDKDGLIDAIVDESFEHLTRLLRRIPNTADPAELLRARARAYVRFSLRHPQHVRLLSALRARQHAPPRSTEETRALLEKPWLELWEAGRLRAGDWKSAAQALWALCHGIVMGRIEAPDHDWSKTLAADAIDALLRGLVIDGDEGSSRE